MRSAATFFAPLLTVLLLAFGTHVSGQALLSSGSLDGVGGESSSTAPDSNQYANGLRALREARWKDAESYFDQVVKDQGRHAEGALYWKAYAEEKKGEAMAALNTCHELSHSHPGSSWNEECGALEVQIRSKNNLRVDPASAQSDEVKLLALNSLIYKNESRALAQISEILNGDSSERLKQGALYILGEHHDNVTYPQIVHLSHVEGDVRIARGARSGHPGDAPWEKAVAGLSLETGFSLATGAGKAEIEFENASTLYLAENSVLVLNDLHTTVGVPFTELALLTGTVSLDIQPFVANEVFLLKTPTDEVVSRYPDRAYFRVDSYLDAMAITPLSTGLLRTPGDAQQELVAGQTLFYLDGQRIEYAGAKDSAALASWDQWVAVRLAERSKAIREVLKASGLTAPVPGLAEMQNQGTFFDCPPYGTCWEPADAGVKKVSAQPQQAQAMLQEADHNAGPTSAVAPLSRQDFGFPCAPEPALATASRDAVTGRNVATTAGDAQTGHPYDWAVCHAGGWIYRDAHYVWVAGQRRHHHPAYLWVKSGQTVAFVPVHPRDVKDQPPVNRKEVVFVLKDRKGMQIEQTQLNPGNPIELMKTAPKEFRGAPVQTLAVAEEPHLVARQLRDALVGKNAVARSGSVPISFDRRTQSFLMARQVMDGRKNGTVIAPLNNRSGNLQEHAANFSAGSRNVGVFSARNSGTHVGTTVTSSSISTSTLVSASKTASPTAPSSGTGVTMNH